MDMELKTLKDKYDQVKWKVSLTPDRKKVVFTDRSVDLTGTAPSAYFYDSSTVVVNAYCYSLPGAYERICAIYQVDEREFIIESKTPEKDIGRHEGTAKPDIGSVFIIRLNPDGKNETLFSALTGKCQWVSEGRLLRINDRYGQSYYYSVHLHKEIKHFFFQETGTALDFEVISSSNPDGLAGLRVRTKEKVFAEFDVDTMEPLSECAYSVLRKRSIPIANFHDFVSVLKEDEDDIKKAEEFYNYDKFYDVKGDRNGCYVDGVYVSLRDNVARIAEALKPELLKRYHGEVFNPNTETSVESGTKSAPAKYIEAEYRFKPWPIAQGKFVYDEEKYAISRSVDYLIIEQLETGTIFPISGGLCVGLLQMEGEGRFLAIFKKISRDGDEALWLHRFDLRHNEKNNKSKAQWDYCYRLENADCQYTEDLICTSTGVYSISRDDFITNWEHASYYRGIGVDIYPAECPLQSRFPAFIVSYHRYSVDNAVYAIVDPIYNSIVGNVAYNQLSQSFTRANSLKDLKKIAEENYRLNEWAKVAISKIAP